MLMLSSLRKIFHITDFTSLNSKDTPSDIIEFCKKAISISEEHGIIGPASICVYPLLVKTVKETIQNENIKICSVAGYFPSGLAPLDLKLKEIDFALSQGANEIDIVLNRANIVSENYDDVILEVSKSKEICEDAHLKVILETGDLNDEQIKIASKISLESGADFIKTSTGKVPVGATIEASTIMLSQIKEYYKLTNVKKGFKAAGGISDSKTALEYYNLVSSILGDEFLSPDYFRIGASRLISNMIAEL